MKLKYFNNIKNEEDLSKKFRTLAKKLHPDTARNDEEKENKTKEFKISVR